MIRVYESLPKRVFLIRCYASFSERVREGEKEIIKCVCLFCLSSCCYSYLWGVSLLSRSRRQAVRLNRAAVKLLLVAAARPALLQF